MSEQTLKDLLKPPFTAYETTIKDNGLITLFLRADKPGYITSKDEYKKLLFWFADACNKEYEREFGERMRWIIDDNEIICPECKTELVFPEQPDFETYKHCPRCAQSLDPPEEHKSC